MGAAFAEAVLLAVGLDLASEWRARAKDLTVIAVFHRMHVLRAAEIALAAAGIPFHARGAFHRVLLHAFGPYLPVQILVAPDRAAEASAVLGENPRSQN
jgi:hypothetical protein